MTFDSKLFPVTAGRDSAGCLTISGHSLRSLAEQYGTPLYLYDAATIQHQSSRLRAELDARSPGEYQVTYAAKAYFSLGFARKLVQMGLGVDVVSLGELEIARQAGFSPDRVHLHGNNKSIEEMRAALQWGVQSIVIDSLEELETLESVAADLRREGRVWLRISPGVAAATHAYLQTAHHASKFGLPIQGGQAAEAVRRAIQSRWLKLTGLHTHLGSQFFDPAPYRSAIDALVGLASDTGFQPEELSPGGGWGVPYIPGQPETEPGPWIETVASSLREACARHGLAVPRLVVEPGRWLAARSAVAVYSVGTTKTAGDGTRFVAVDGGMADNTRPALYQAVYVAVLADRPDALADQKVNIVGKYCESGDQLIHDALLPEARRGDLLVIPVAGAYQLSMASNYNLSQRPAVLWLENGRVEVLQQRERLAQSPWWLGE